MQDSDVEVSIKDIVEFYIKIDDSARAKSDIAKLSASDKARAFTQIAHSNASREFKVEIARYFVNDLDAHIRRKAELLLEDLVPGWVADPSSSILQVLRSAESKGPARRNAAVRFLFGIVDADSLRITITSLLPAKTAATLWRSSRSSSSISPSRRTKRSRSKYSMPASVSCCPTKLRCRSNTMPATCCPPFSKKSPAPVLARFLRPNTLSARRKKPRAFSVFCAAAPAC